MAQLLSAFGKKGVRLGLDTLQVDIEDTSFLSKYFVISEFNPVFSAGRNPISFNGSPLIKNNSEIQVECLDSNGNSLYIERPTQNVTYVDISEFVVAVHIYNETYNGAGKLIFVGRTTKNEVVRWKSNITIDKTLQNTSKVRFYNKPTIEARNLIYPVVTNDAGTSLAKTIPFSGQFYSLPINPSKDTNKRSINAKKTDIDYRVSFNSNVSLGSQLYPTTSFNTQMEGQAITLNVSSINTPFSYGSQTVNLTSSFKIKKVLNDTTLQLTEPFFYTLGKDQLVTNINVGTFEIPYTWLAYNTAADAYQPSVKESYAEITYRNIRPFSGFVARHKLYRKSMVYPGDFQLIADEPLGALELLTDPVTNNKTYNLMGSFYNQVHVNKYWFTSSAILQMSHSVDPYINAVKIYAPTHASMSGLHYAIVKADSSNTVNDATYVAYDSASFNSISGLSYNSNFINLKKDSLYVLSTNIVIEKDQYAKDAKVSFYFTSSIPGIELEKTYVSPFGLRIGDITTTDATSVKIFSEKQMLFFTPSNDYYGTLVIVPYHCDVVLSDLSLKVYGDYGFSPDILFTKIPFKVNVANEPFQLKAELFDINSTLIYSDLQTIQTFDAAGESLYVFIGNSNLDPSNLTFVSASLVISKSLYLPNIPNCPAGGGNRLLGYHAPVNTPPKNSDGQVCYTNITDLSSVSIGGSSVPEYINLQTIAGVTTTTARSIAVKYTGSAVDGGPYGKRIFVNIAGTKTVYS